MEFFQHIIHEFELPLKSPVLVFSLILFIILISPILLRKLNIPGIIGLILSGLIVGPYGLKLIEHNSAIDLFSTIGLLYIMFIAGLKLDMNEFKSNRNKSLLFGVFTFTFPLAIGFPVCYYILGYDINASLLTASMLATHTLVAYPIVSKLGIYKNEAVAITVGGTIFTDTAVLMILAVIIGNSQGSLNNDFWIRLGISLIVFLALMFWLIPRIAKWFFSKLESEKHSHYIFVLAVVFFAAFLAEVSGLEPIIGAFIAGIALNKLIPSSSALMNRIEFIGNSLFIPFFLISVGMLVDIRVLLNGPAALIVAGTLTAVALFGKWIAAYLTRILFRYSKSQGNLIFGLSSSHAAATLAVILVGYQSGILNEDILNGTVILILISCMVASFVTEKAAKKIALDAQDETPGIISKNGLGTEHILIPIANIANIEKMLEFSILIKDNKSTNPLSILSVVSNNEEAANNIIKTRNKLEEHVNQAMASETKVSIITTIDHNPASGIVRISKEVMANIIVMGWFQKSGIIDKLLGEKIDNIVNNTDKTIFICHFKKDLLLHKRIFMAAPPKAEKETGFEQWFFKIIKLGLELSTPIHFYGNTATLEAIRLLLKKSKASAHLKLLLFEDWDNFTSLSAFINPEDLFVLVSARKGSASYLKEFENLPSKLEKNFPFNSRLVIFPHQFSHNYSNEQFDDIIHEPNPKGIETIQKIGKGIGKIFKQ